MPHQFACGSTAHYGPPICDQYTRPFVPRKHDLSIPVNPQGPNGVARAQRVVRVPHVAAVGASTAALAPTENILIYAQATSSKSPSLTPLINSFHSSRV
jgi:hypothetical protein